MARRKKNGNTAGTGPPNGPGTLPPNGPGTLPPNGPRTLRKATEAERDDEDLVTRLVIRDGEMLQYASERLRGNRSVVLAAVARNESALQYASAELRDDRDFVCEAFGWLVCSFAYRYVSGRLKADRQVAEQFLTIWPGELGMVAEAFRNDKELVAAAVIAGSARTFQHASPELKKDSEFVLHLMSKGCNIFEYVAPELRDDGEIATKAVNIGLGAYGLMSQRLRDDEDIARQALEKECALLEQHYSTEGSKPSQLTQWSQGPFVQTSERLRGNLELATLAVRGRPSALKIASKELQDNEELVRIAVRRDGEALAFASERLRDDLGVVQLAIAQAPVSLQHASKRLRGDLETVNIAVSARTDTIKYALLPAVRHADLAPALRTLYPFMGYKGLVECKHSGSAMGGNSSSLRIVFPSGLKAGSPAQLFREHSCTYIGRVEMTHTSEQYYGLGTLVAADPPFSDVFVCWPRLVSYKRWDNYGRGGEHDVGNSGWQAHAGRSAASWERLNFNSMTISKKGSTISIPEAARTLLESIVVASVIVEVEMDKAASDDKQLVVTATTLAGDAYRVLVPRESSVTAAAAIIKSQLQAPPEAEVALLCAGKVLPYWEVFANAF
eukprot:TRINITY_DN16000_c0_g1_i1.p1 TRINITY_DN16000_c0_g1~~TRINITY_DN16000_c0_g1_i1.p1  ORF type:complete len:614 (+),score=46.74 TRINITY_DN16000_c0_g1_i1:138-1979(+)